jgi:hypothetical protein
MKEAMHYKIQFTSPVYPWLCVRVVNLVCCLKTSHIGKTLSSIHCLPDQVSQNGYLCMFERNQLYYLSCRTNHGPDRPVIPH